MNLSTVKSIAVPEGNVTALSIGGVKVWAVPQTAASPWDEVAAAIADGTYKTKYKIGDMVPLDLGSEGLINMQIAAFDTDALADGSGTAAISWVAKELLPTTRRMNPARSGSSGAYVEGTGSVGGWEKCELRTYMNNIIKPMIPENASRIIVPVSKKQKAYSATSTTYEQTTSDELWIPDYYEVIYSSGYSHKYGDLFINSDSRKKVLPDGTSLKWWLRRAGSATNFFTISTSGGSTSTNAQDSAGVCLGFCTGRTPT